MAGYCTVIRDNVYYVPLFMFEPIANKLLPMDSTPVLFISHGSPTFALEPGLLGPKLEAIGAQLAGVRAVLVVSAHWQSRGVRVMSGAAPETVHDFGGFPAELYRLQYPAPGAPELAAEAARLLTAAGFAASLDAQRGFDHGAWVPLRYLYGAAQMPVFQVSMPHDLDAASALRLGAALAPLRQQGVLIVGSGGLTHNLGDYFHGATAATSYAPEFASWIEARVLAGDRAAVAQYRERAPFAERAHPSEDHFLPLPVAMGASSKHEVPQLISGGMDHGVLSMDSFIWSSAS
jgi:4,5-DOPA dioxygenase extradiol